MRALLLLCTILLLAVVPALLRARFKVEKGSQPPIIRVAMRDTAIAAQLVTQLRERFDAPVDSFVQSGDSLLIVALKLGAYRPRIRALRRGHCIIPQIAGAAVDSIVALLHRSYLRERNVGTLALQAPADTTDATTWSGEALCRTGAQTQLFKTHDLDTYASQR